MSPSHPNSCRSSARAVLALATLALMPDSGAAARAADYAIGADLSFLKQAEDGGTVFKDNGIKVVVASNAKAKLKQQQPKASYVLYAENVTPGELATILNQLGAPGKKAQAKYIP